MSVQIFRDPLRLWLEGDGLVALADAKQLSLVDIHAEHARCVIMRETIRAFAELPLLKVLMRGY